MTTEDAARARARRPAGMSSAEEAASMNTRAYGSVGGSLSDLTCALLETRDAAWAAEIQRLWDERDAAVRLLRSHHLMMNKRTTLHTLDLCKTCAFLAKMETP